MEEKYGKQIETKQRIMEVIHGTKSSIELRLAELRLFEVSVNLIDNETQFYFQYL